MFIYFKYKNYIYTKNNLFLYSIYFKIRIVNIGYIIKKKLSKDFYFIVIFINTIINDENR